MIRAFEVRPVLNGYIVSIGCQTLVFTDREDMLALMDAYLQHPESTEKAMLEDSINAKHMSPMTQPAVPEGSISCNPFPPEAFRDQAEDRPSY